MNERSRAQTSVKEKKIDVESANEKRLTYIRCQLR